MTDALEEHQGTVSIGGKTITNLRFADDIDGLAGKEEELASLVDRLNKTMHGQLLTVLIQNKVNSKENSVRDQSVYPISRTIKSD